MTGKPVVAVTGPDHGGMFAWLMTRHALWRCGARALRIRPGSYREGGAFDGLILGGGSDINPAHYGEAMEELKESLPGQSLKEKLLSLGMFLLRAIFSIKLRQARRDPARDDLEMKLCREALRKGLPVLGICRGAQLINITLGGSLHQSTAPFYTETPHMRTIRPVREVTVENRSRLAAILGETRTRVNALHDQAINRLGEGLVVCARDRNGIIQAIENPDRAFVIGVQWHPEYLPRLKPQRRLFRALVAACSSVD